MQIKFGLSALLVSAAPAALFVCAPAALAQSVPVVSRPVVQALPSADAQRLNSALARVARDPRDYLALIDAGDAANAMGDPEAAAGFYKRAEAIFPGHVRVKAGLARALVLQGKAAEAIPMFASAEAGGGTVDVTSDRGLAYDLVGDPVTAQRYYRTAMARRDDDEVRRRLGVSLVIAGDVAGGEAMLMPLLSKQDKPAWRAYAFALAIAGKAKESVDTVNAILPPALAQSVTPYLRYMPRLTRAQQAAAVNLGQFPRASEIGRDDPAIAAFAPTVTRVAAADTALIPRGKPLNAGRGQSSSSVKAAPPLSASEKRAQEKAAQLAKAQAAQSRVAPPEPHPTISRSGDGELPALAQPVPMAPVSRGTVAAQATSKPVEPVAPPPASPAAASHVAATTSVSASAPVQSSIAQPALPASTSFDLAKAGTSTAAPATAAVQGNVAALAPASTPTTTPTGPVPTGDAVAQPASQWAKDVLSLEQAFANLGAPSRAPVRIAGAVDVRSIEPSKPVPEREAAPDPAILKAKLAEEAQAKENAAKEAARSAAAKRAADAKAAEAKKIADAKKAEAAKIAEAKAIALRHPSRIWVQVGVGRDKSAIAFDWRRLARANPEVFKGRNPYINAMGRTNRILMGPFESHQAAADMVAKVKRAGVGGAHAWSSAVGEVVDALIVK